MWFISNTFWHGVRSKYIDAVYMTICTIDLWDLLEYHFLCHFFFFLFHYFSFLAKLLYFAEVIFSHNFFWSLFVPELKTVLLPTHFVLCIILPQIYSWSLELSAASSVEAIFISRISKIYTAGKTGMLPSMLKQSHSIFSCQVDVIESVVLLNIFCCFRSRRCLFILYSHNYIKVTCKKLVLTILFYFCPSRKITYTKPFMIDVCVIKTFLLYRFWILPRFSLWYGGM